MTDAAVRDDVPVPNDRRTELAAFLRSRRGRIAPEQFGLAPGGRRRTPGLRREEVAQLSGIGVTWYTWLEQGRPIKVSEQVLDAVARTLQLDDAERSHLFTLADIPLPAAKREPLEKLTCAQRLIDKLHPFPAQVLNERFDVLVWNGAAARLFRDWGSVPQEDRNILLWLYGASPSPSSTLLNWEQEHPRLVAVFRASYAKHVGEPQWEDLVARLLDTGPEFVKVWEEHDVAYPQARLKEFLHVDAGLLRFRASSYLATELRDARVSVHLPADDETAAKLEAWA